MIAWPEEIAYHKCFIDAPRLQQWAAKLQQNRYGEYQNQLLNPSRN